MKIEEKQVYHNKRCDECSKLIKKEKAFLIKPSFITDKVWCLCKECKQRMIKNG